jgi:hypothetical protein
MLTGFPTADTLPRCQLRCTCCGVCVCLRRRCRQLAISCVYRRRRTGSGLCRIIFWTWSCALPDGPRCIRIRSGLHAARLRQCGAAAAVHLTPGLADLQSPVTTCC